MDIGTPTEGDETSEPAAPEPSVAVTGRLGPDPGATIDLGTILREAWAIFAAAWPACLVVYWGACAASWLVLFVLTMALASFNVLIGDREVTPVLEFIRFAGLFLVPAWIWLGQTRAFLKLARRQPVALEELFQGGPYVLTAVLATGIVLAVCAGPWWIIYRTAETWLALGGYASLVSLFQQLTAVPMPALPDRLETTMLVLMAVVASSYCIFLAVLVRFGQFPYLIIDRGADVLESLRRSWEVTSGRVATVILVYMAQFTMNLAGLLACYVGLFVTLPLTSFISAVTYHLLVASCRLPVSGEEE
jgi:uncharacterized membrane protein